MRQTRIYRAFCIHQSHGISKCIVLFNATTSSQTVSLETTYYHLRTAYGQSINNAAAVTSVTLPTFAYSNSCSGFTGTTATTGEACILMRTPT